MKKILILGFLLFSGLTWSKLPITFVFDELSPPYSFLNEKSELVGLFPDLVKNLFSNFSEYDLKLKSAPWPRAQLMIESGEADGFLTYPSEKRKQYSVFSQNSLFVEDIGYIIFSKVNSQKSILKKSKSFDDLKSLTFLGSESSDWETQNLPNFIKKVNTNSDETRFHLLFKRNAGDYLIMGVEQAKYFSDKLSYSKDIEYQKVKYIPESEVNFNIGISIRNQKSKELILKINKIMSTSKYKKIQKKIIDSYRI